MRVAQIAFSCPYLHVPLACRKAVVMAVGEPLGVANHRGSFQKTRPLMAQQSGRDVCR